MWFILGQITAASDAPFQPPGNTWTLYTNPTNNNGDILYSRTFDKWYLAPRASGNAYYSSDGLTWTSTTSTNYNGPLLAEVNGNVVMNAKYNNSGQAQTNYHYSTNGTTFGSNSVDTGALLPAYSSTHSTYLSGQGVSNTSDQYATASSLGGGWTIRTKSGLDNDMNGAVEANGNAFIFGYDDIWPLSSSSSLGNPISLPASNISRWSYNPGESFAYFWQGSINSDNAMWKFNGSTFTAVSTFDRPTGTSTWEAGIGVGIVDEELIEGEYLANWASGFISSDVARLFTPTHGYKYVASYFPGRVSADYSPDANMYITNTSSVGGNYYLIRSTDG